jgi:putative SbcD/Mre11-related phosphoesterase
MRTHTDWLLTPERAAVHLPTATAVIADLHLGYAEARRRRGEALPVVRPAEALAPLRAVFARHAVRALVIAGDLFEEAWSATDAAAVQDWLAAQGVELAGVVPGNHDRRLPREGSGLPVSPEGVVLGRWRIVHGDGELPAGWLVHGHFHPWLRWGRVSVPCYLLGRRRIVLPAFSHDAAGVNVLGGPWEGYRCAAIAEGEVLDLGPVGQLVARRIRASSGSVDAGR